MRFAADPDGIGSEDNNKTNKQTKTNSTCWTTRLRDNISLADARSGGAHTTRRLPIGYFPVLSPPHSN